MFSQDAQERLAGEIARLAADIPPDYMMTIAGLEAPRLLAAFPECGRSEHEILEAIVRHIRTQEGPTIHF